jgi:hypothetical protein
MPWVLFAIGAAIAYILHGSEQLETSDERSRSTQDGGNRAGRHGGSEPRPAVEGNHGLISGDDSGAAKVETESEPKVEPPTPTPETGKE